MHPCCYGSFVAVAILLIPALIQPLPHISLREASSLGSWPDLLCFCPANFPWVVVVRLLRPLIRMIPQTTHTRALAGAVAWQGLFTRG
jgi:hypothetical protein